MSKKLLQRVFQFIFYYYTYKDKDPALSRLKAFKAAKATGA